MVITIDKVKHMLGLYRTKGKKIWALILKAFSNIFYNSYRKVNLVNVYFSNNKVGNDTSLSNGIWDKC